ncbi:MAG: hypothetical protein KDD51_03715 [Bdellovibrionales bacterium]|nr:hypothetical protein [Bdellovibrionales bacterium]
MKKLMVMVGALCAFGALAAEFDTQEAFYLYLNRAGLSLSARELQQQFLGDINSEPLPDFDEKGWGGIRAQGRGLSYTVDFGDLKIVPAKDRLELSLDVNYVRVHLNSVRLSKKILVEISSTCENTAIEVNGPVTVGAHLGLSVSQGAVHVSAPNLSFPLPEDKYKVDGPSKCSGALGVGHLIKLVVKEALKRSRTTIEKKIVEQASKLAPKLQQQLNQAVIRDIPFEVEKFIPFPDAAPILRTSPHYVRIDSRGMEFVMNVDVARDSLPLDEATSWLDAAATNVGQAGVNPQLFGELLGKVLPVGTWIGLEEELVPGVQEALKIEHAAAIWPDLRQVEVTKGYLRPLIRFAGAPEFSVIADEALVRVKIPLEMLFQIHQHGWKNYYTFKLDLDLTTSLNIEGEKLGVALKPQTVLNLKGEWAVGYEPHEAYVESEVAEVIFLSLFDVLYAKGNLLKVDVPKVPFGGASVSLSHPQIVAPYIRVGLEASGS